MGQSVESDVEAAFQRLCKADPHGGMAALLVLSEKQVADGAGRINNDRRVRVLQQPVSLRMLRTELETLFTDLGKPLPVSTEGDEG